MKKLTWRKAINKILEESSKPLHYKEITERITSERLVNTIGATPNPTVSSEIMTSIKMEVVSV